MLSRSSKVYFQDGVFRVLTTKEPPARSNKAEPFLIPLWEV